MKRNHTLLYVLAGAAVFGIGYYLKIYRPKHRLSGEDVDDYDDYNDIAENEDADDDPFYEELKEYNKKLDMIEKFIDMLKDEQLVWNEEKMKELAEDEEKTNELVEKLQNEWEELEQ
jgi:hypothetical protein